MGSEFISILAAPAAAAVISPTIVEKALGGVDSVVTDGSLGDRFALEKASANIATARADPCGPARRFRFNRPEIIGLTVSPKLAVSPMAADALGAVSFSKIPGDNLSLTRALLTRYRIESAKFREPTVSEVALNEHLPGLAVRMTCADFFLIVRVAQLYHRRMNQADLTFEILGNNGGNLAVNALLQLPLTNAERWALVRMAEAFLYPAKQNDSREEVAVEELRTAGWLDGQRQTARDFMRNSCATFDSRVRIPDGLKAQLAWLNYSGRRISNADLLLLTRASELCHMARHRYGTVTFENLLKIKEGRQLIRIFAAKTGFSLTQDECLALLLIAEHFRYSDERWGASNIERPLAMLQEAGWEEDQKMWIVELMESSVTYFSGPVALDIATVENFLNMCDRLGRLARTVLSEGEISDLDEVLDYPGSRDLLERLALIGELRGFHAAAVEVTAKDSDVTTDVKRLAEVRENLWRRLNAMWVDQEGARLGEMTLVEVLLYAGLTLELERIEGQTRSYKPLSVQNWYFSRDYVALAPLVIILFRDLQKANSILELRWGENLGLTGITVDYTQFFLPLVDASFIHLTTLFQVSLAIHQEESHQKDLRRWRIRRRDDLQAILAAAREDAARQPGNLEYAKILKDLERTLPSEISAHERWLAVSHPHTDDELERNNAAAYYETYHDQEFWTALIYFAKEKPDERLLVIQDGTNNVVESVRPGAFLAFARAQGLDTSSRSELFVLGEILRSDGAYFHDDFIERAKAFDDADPQDPHLILIPTYRTQAVIRAEEEARGRQGRLVRNRLGLIDGELE